MATACLYLWHPVLPASMGRERQWPADLPPWDGHARSCPTYIMLALSLIAPCRCALCRKDRPHAPSHTTCARPVCGRGQPRLAASPTAILWSLPYVWCSADEHGPRSALGNLRPVGSCCHPSMVRLRRLAHVRLVVTVAAGTRVQIAHMCWPCHAGAAQGLTPALWGAMQPQAAAVIRKLLPHPCDVPLAACRTAAHKPPCVCASPHPLATG